MVPTAWGHSRRPRVSGGRKSSVVKRPVLGVDRDPPSEDPL